MEVSGVTVWFQTELFFGEDLANELLMSVVGRDPKTELKEPTKRR